MLRRFFGSVGQLVDFSKKYYTRVIKKNTPKFYLSIFYLNC